MGGGEVVAPSIPHFEQRECHSADSTRTPQPGGESGVKRGKG